MKAVRESAILDGYPGVCLGESSRPPRLSGEPQQLGGQHEFESSSSLSTLYAQRSQADNYTKDFEMPHDTNNTSSISNMVCYVSQLGGAHGVPIIIKDTMGKAPTRESTVGGFIHVGTQLFGLTVAHAFQDNVRDDKEKLDEDIEFSFENDSQDEDEDVVEDKNFINMTSRGSISPDQNLFGGSPSTDSAEHSRYEMNLKASPAAALNQLGLPKSATEHVLNPLGRLAAVSEASQTSDLDWALVRIDQPLSPSIQQSLKSILPRSLARDPPGKDKIQVMTTSEYIIQGTITGGSTFMQLPHSVAFQEMWSVQLDGPLKHGDCGSWVVDFDSGKLYGYITAGDPQTSIAYIIPAYQAFHDIEQRFKDRVTFPSFSESSPLPRAQTPERASFSTRTLLSPPPQTKQHAFRPLLPQGQCRYILLNPEIKGLRCPCTGFMWNESVPGSACDCGHQACYHTPKKETTAVEATELAVLKDKVALLEKELDRERHAGRDLIDRLGRLEEFVDKTKAETENDLRNTHRSIGGLWHNIEILKKRTTYYDDQIERLDDDAQRLCSQLIEIDDASMRVEDRVDALEVSSVTKGSDVAEQITGHETAQPNLSQFRSKIGSQRGEAWTVHVSLLPTSSQPFPFEKDTAAYKRCLSRGLHQMIVISNKEHESFVAAIDEAFSEILQGRRWQPLVAVLCDSKALRGLPMLRQLPDAINSGQYDAEFLQNNCAVVDESGKILDIYIAMVEDTLTWTELKAMAPFKSGLEAAWTYDPYLDGPHNDGDENNLDSETPEKLAAGDIVGWTPSLKRNASEISRTPSFSSSASLERIKPGAGGKRLREETHTRTEAV